MLGVQVEGGLKKSSIAKLADYFSPRAVQFTQFKEPYRLVVGHVFSKAHRAMSEKVLQRSQVKLGLFCCHLINRIFEKEYRSEIFTHYFEWLKVAKRPGKFEFGSFREWIRSENPERLVQTVEAMNDKFYRKK
jgi:adenine-specific DNA methylase